MKISFFVLTGSKKIILTEKNDYDWFEPTGNRNWRNPETHKMFKRSLHQSGALILKLIELEY